MAIALIGLLVVLGLAYLPSLWVQSVMRRYAAERPDFPGTGAEFARHLLDRLNLGHVTVEETKQGDHYDPGTKTVRLSPANMHRKSLAAVVVAAHEVGHAIQDASGYAPLHARVRLAKQAEHVERIGSVVMLASPLVLIFAKAPWLMFMQLAAGLAILSFTILMHAVTLPVEFDASFRRAMPVLKDGGYLKDDDLGGARHILRAAAFTYVAAAGMSLLNVMRWFRVLRI